MQVQKQEIQKIDAYIKYWSYGKTSLSNANAKNAFNYLWLAFIKAPILRYFDLQSYIQIENTISGNAISKVLS